MIASMMCVGGRCGGGNDIVVVVETNATVLAAWRHGRLWRSPVRTQANIVFSMLSQDLKSDAAMIVKSFPSLIRPEYVRSIQL